MAFDKDELTVLSMSGPTWLKVLQRKEKNILDKMYGEFRSGKTDFLTLIAEFASLRDQMIEIKNGMSQLAAKQGEQ